MDALVLSDTSPLIALGRLGGLAWVGPLFARVSVTRQVRSELIPDPPRRDRPVFLDAFERGLLVVHPSDTAPERLPHLGGGEASTILAAAGEPPPVLVLMDDRAGER